MDKCTRFEAVMVVKFNIQIFTLGYDICRLIGGYQLSGLTYCLLLHGRIELSPSNSMTDGQSLRFG
jgi:hypothetical protein